MAARGKTIEMRRKDILKYKPGDTFLYEDTSNFPKDLHIALFGIIECGKTSLMNSFMFAAQGEWEKTKWLQVSKEEKMGGYTMMRTKLQITKSIHVIDNRGLQTQNKESIRNMLDEIKAQLAGRRSYTSIVDWSGTKWSGDVEQGDRINTAVFVYSAAQDISPGVYELSKMANEIHNILGHYPVAVITHMDEKDPAKVEQLQRHLHMFGMTNIFHVVNINDDNVILDEESQEIFLELLERCITDGDRNMMYHLQSEEEKRRKREREAEERRKIERNKSWCSLM